MTTGHLLIRADATVQIGTGHIMRMLALAQAWQAAGGTVTLAAHAMLPDTLAARLRAEGAKLYLLDVKVGSRDDATRTVELAQSLGASVVAVDGYHFNAAYQKALKDAELRLLFVDDNGHAQHYYADYVLNQNIHADARLYTNREPDTQLLLGTRYALLRREFWDWRDWVRETPIVVHKLLVTMGGTDPDNVTGKVLAALNAIDTDGLEVTAIIGGSNPHVASLESIAAQSLHKVYIEHNVSSMPRLLAWADMAVSAGGSTTWELAFMGVPAVLVAVADNQVGITQRMNKCGAALSLGWHDDLAEDTVAATVYDLAQDAQRRRVLSEQIRALVDGDGGARVARQLTE